MIAGTVIGRVQNVELVEGALSSEKSFVLFTLKAERYDAESKQRVDVFFQCVASTFQYDWLAKQEKLSYRVAVVFNDLKASMSFEASLKVCSVSGL